MIEKIWLIFDIQNGLWKYYFGTFWQTFITRRIFLKIFLWLHVDSWPKSLLWRTHHLWNSMTELILLYTTRSQDLWSCSRIQDVVLWDKPNIDLECWSVIGFLRSLNNYLIFFFSKNPLLHTFLAFLGGFLASNSLHNLRGQK